MEAKGMPTLLVEDLRKVEQPSEPTLESMWKLIQERKNQPFTMDHKPESRIFKEDSSLVKHKQKESTQKIDNKFKRELKESIQKFDDEFNRRVEAAIQKFYEQRRMEKDPSTKDKNLKIQTKLNATSQLDLNNPSGPSVLPLDIEHMKMSILKEQGVPTLVVSPPPERRRSRVVEEELARLREEDRRREVEHQRKLAEVQVQLQAQITAAVGQAMEDVFTRLAAQGFDLTAVLKSPEPQNSTQVISRTKLGQINKFARTRKGC